MRLDKHCCGNLIFFPTRYYEERQRRSNLTNSKFPVIARSISDEAILLPTVKIKPSA